MKFTLWLIFLTNLIVQAQNNTIPPTDLGRGGNPIITTLTDGSFLIFSLMSSNQISVYNADGHLSRTFTLQVDNIQETLAAALSDDSFVLCWTESNGSINIMYAQRFYADGTPLSEPFRISYDNVVALQLTGLNDGGYVIVWTVQYSVEITFSCGLVFNSDNSPRGKQFLIYQESLDTWQGTPVATSLISGQFFVTWNHPDSIYGQLFSSDGTPQSQPILISTNVSVFSASAAASLVSGKIVVTWQGWDGKSPQTFRVYAQILNLDGTLAGDNFLVQTNEPAYAIPLIPAITALHNGRFVICWFSGSTFNGSSSELYFRLYEADGAPIGGPILINAPDTGKNQYPQIAAMQDGGFIIIFQSWGSTSCDIFAQRYSENGVVIPFADTNTTLNELIEEKTLIVEDLIR